MKCIHLLLLLLLTVAGCANEPEPHFLGMDYEASMARLDRGDYSFLSDFEYSESQPVYRIDEGAAYYIGRVFEEKGRPETAVQFFSRQWEVDAEPWRSEAGLRFVELLLNEVDVAPRARRALAIVETLSGEIEGGEFEEGERPEHLPEDRFNRDAILTARADLLLELERYEELTALSSEAAGTPALYPRLAVAAFERGEHGQARDYVYQTVKNAPRDTAITRLVEAFDSEGYDERVTAELAEVLSARAAVADSEWDDAVETFGNNNADELFEALDKELRWARPVIGDIREAYFRGGKPREGASALRSIAGDGDSNPSAPPEVLTYLYQSAGRLYRNAGANHEAVDVLGQAIDTARDSRDRDTALFHYLHASVSADPVSLVQRLDDRLDGSSEAARHNRPLERLLANIIAARRWDLLAEAYPSVRAHASGRSAAQYGVSYAAALRAGFLAPPADEDAAEAERRLLEQAANQTESRYYAILGAVMLGETPHALPGERDVERSVVPGPDDDLISGYLEYGLLGPAYEAVYGEGRRSGQSVTRELAERLAADGQLLESLRIANRLSRIEGVVIDTDLAELIYPRAYEDELLPVTDEYDIPEYLFYGLVREESYFDAAIQSWVGATGLAQLMPATAADVAARLGVSDYDLTDPETNLRFGARYLSDLYRSFGTWTPSLIAYNAGQGRVRRWQALRGDLPPILFHESVPIHEPRDYIRKILVSAVHYRHLYEDGSVNATVEDFFPGIVPAGSD